MTRFPYIVLFTLLGFFLMPTMTYACGTTKELKSEKSCNKKEKSSAENTDCCEKGQGEKHEKNCEGKCKNPSCHCPTSNCYTFTMPFFIQFSQTKIIESKSKFYYQEMYYSSKFLSIWLPPKIS